VSPRKSNAQRIALAAAEAEATAKEKTAAKKKVTKKKATKKRVSKKRTPKAPPRLKIVWAVGPPGLPPLKVYPYRERAAADADSDKRGKNSMVRPLKVPMEAGE
jgi:hypothetical protein